MKQVRRSVKQILFSLTLVMVFFINIHPVMAQEISNESKNAIWNEFEEKRENGLEVYELLDDNGNFMGYYEPYSEKFEKIFDAYCGNNKLESFHMQYLAYWVEPVIIENDEDICVA